MRRRLQAALSFTLPCLLPLLQPVRLCLHQFLSSQDAARLMQTSSSITAFLLAGYEFDDHIFTYHTMAEAKRSFAFYARNHMRVLSMCLPHDCDEPLVVSETGQSVLPASLVALMLGEESSSGALSKSAVYAALRDREAEEAEVWDEGGWAEYGGRWLTRLVRQWEETNSCSTWGLVPYRTGAGFFDKPIPPGALPHSLRCLLFNNNYNQPLQVGSIPEGVEVVQFGHNFSQSLQAGQLPASLTHLALNSYFNQPLLPGVLPAGLRRLHLGDQYNHPLLLGTLPSSLQQLSLSEDFNQPINPGTLPTSLTHLRLSDLFNQPLQPGSIPHGVVRLHLGFSFNRPLLPGVLPTSLRELAISYQYQRALQPGSLPDGLRVLAFHPCSDFQQPLQFGVIPASVVVLSMSREYRAELVAGGIPATTRWLRLPIVYAGRDLRGVLSPGTRVVWWEKREADAEDE